MTLILASASPRRRDLLGRAGIRFEVVPADVDESVLPGEEPTDYVTRVASAKASAVARHGAWVLAADTTVVVGGEILAKAEDSAEATRMLRLLSGRTHSVLTATVLRGPGHSIMLIIETEVDFRALSDREIASYVEGGEWRGKAGAYGAQGQAAAFITAIRGSFTNVIGLPLAETVALLERHGVARPEYT